MRILGNRLLLAPIAKPDQTPGGIVLVEKYQDDRTQYRVLARGTGSKIPEEIQPGCCVLTPLYFDHTTLEDGTGRKIVGIEQIIAVWQNESPTA